MKKISFSDENENYDVSLEVIEQESLRSFKNIEKLADGYKSKLEKIGWYVNLKMLNLFHFILILKMENR